MNGHFIMLQRSDFRPLPPSHSVLIGLLWEFFLWVKLWPAATAPSVQNRQTGTDFLTCFNVTHSGQLHLDHVSFVDWLTRKVHPLSLRTKSVCPSRRDSLLMCVRTWTGSSTRFHYGGSPVTVASWHLGQSEVVTCCRSEQDVHRRWVSIWVSPALWQQLTC